MRNLHCLLVSILLLISQGLLAQSTEVTGKAPDSEIPISSTNNSNVIEQVFQTDDANARVRIHEAGYRSNNKFPCLYRVKIV